MLVMLDQLNRIETKGSIGHHHISKLLRTLPSSHKEILVYLLILIDLTVYSIWLYTDSGKTGGMAAKKLAYSSTTQTLTTVSTIIRSVSSIYMQSNSQRTQMLLFFMLDSFCS